MIYIPKQVPILDSFKLEDELIDSYDLISQNLLNGRGFSYSGKYPTITRTPLYPLYLAIPIYLSSLISCNNYVFMRFAHIILDSLTSVFVYLGAHSAFKNKSLGVYSGLLYALNPVVMYYIIHMCPEALANFFVILFYLSIIVSAHNPNSKLAVIFAGIAAGMFVLNKSVFIAVIFLLFPFILMVYKSRQKVLNYIFVLIIALGVVSPWIIRNYFVSGRFIIQTLTGFNFWYDFTQDENRNKSIVDCCHGNISRTFTGKSVFLPNGIEYKPYWISAKDDAMYDFILIKEAIKWICDNPFRFVLKVIDNIFAFWYFAESPLKMFIAGFVSLVLILLACRGITNLVKYGYGKNIALAITIILILNLTYSPIMAVFRYSLVVHPLLCILSCGNFIDHGKSLKKFQI